MATTKLLDLPSEVLLAVALPLDTRDRACLFAACRRLRELGASAPSVWEELRGVALAYPSQALRFARWLAGEGRAAHVRRLHLALRYPDKSGVHATLLPAACGPLGAPPEAPPLLSTLRQLVSLEWQARGNIELGSWLAAMPRLERVQVGSVDGRVSLRGHLSWVTTLHALRVWGSNGVDMEPACLPPQLEEADIHQPPTTAVTAMAAGAGGSLRRLCLARCRAVLDCRDLGKLTAVTSLSLSGCHLAAVPPQIASLTQLQDLCLATNKLGGEGWAFLLPLRRLSQLDLRHQLGNRRLALPAGLLALPSLQVLQCADNPFTTSLPGPAVVPAPSAPGRLALQTLSLDFEVAARSHDALRALPSLRALWLVAAQGQVGVAAPGLKDAAALLTGLSRFPGLRVRWWDSLHGRAEFDISQPLQLAGLVLRVAQRYPALLAMQLG